mgnify:CR=1 FL=1
MKDDKMLSERVPGWVWIAIWVVGLTIMYITQGD